MLLLGKHTEAIDAFSSVTRHYGESKYAPVSAYWLIHCCYANGNEIGAERETWLLMERFPDTEYAADALLKLASYYMDSGVAQKAENTLDLLIKQTRFPRVRARAIYEKALLAFHAGDTTGAMKWLQTLQETYPDDPIIPDACYLKGDVLKKQLQFEAAELAYLDAATRKPGSVLEIAALGSAGDCRFAIAGRDEKPEEFAQALAGYEKILALPDVMNEYLAMVRYKAGRAAQLSNDEDKAIDYFMKTVYALPARDASARPAETFWTVKSIEMVEQLAGKNPTPDRVDKAVHALSWLIRASLQESPTIRDRIKVLRKKKIKL